MVVRIEIHLDKTETNILDAIAKEDGRSRKNLCETEIRKLIKERGQNFSFFSFKYAPNFTTKQGGCR